MTEIEKLKAEVEHQKAIAEAMLDSLHKLGEDYRKALEEINRKQTEIERLNAVSEICGECHKKYAEKIAKAKSEAIKELAKRVKQEINFPLAVWRVFDKIVAEMVGDTDE